MDEITKKFGFDKMPLETLVKSAYDEISALCKGKDWLMSIPIQPSDSDIILTEALLANARAIERLNKRIEALRAGLETITESDSPYDVAWQTLQQDDQNEQAT